MNNILIIDGTNLLYRSYFGHKYRRNSKDIHIGAIYGFYITLNRYIDEFQPKQVYIAFDKSEYTFRNEIYAHYKAHRSEPEEDLLNQFEMLRAFCEYSGIPFIEKDMYEADDIIGSLAIKSKDYGFNPIVITGDRDIFQLISNGIDILYLSPKGPEVYDEEKFTDRYNIPSEKFLYYKALVGDISDNIPGVAGIGKKSAEKLLEEYSSLDDIYNNLEKIPKGMNNKLEKNRENAYLSFELSKIVLDLKLDYDKYFIDLIDLGFNINSKELVEYFKTLEINI